MVWGLINKLVSLFYLLIYFFGLCPVLMLCLYMGCTSLFFITHTSIYLYYFCLSSHKGKNKELMEDVTIHFEMV